MSAVMEADYPQDFWQVTTEDEREALFAVLHRLKCNPSLDEIPLVMSEVAAILRKQPAALQEGEGPNPQEYLDFADAMHGKLFHASGAKRDDAKPYQIANLLVMSVKILANALANQPAKSRTVAVPHDLVQEIADCPLVVVRDWSNRCRALLPYGSTGGVSQPATSQEGEALATIASALGDFDAAKIDSLTVTRRIGNALHMAGAKWDNTQRQYVFAATPTPPTDWGYGADINMPSDYALLFRAVSSARPVRDVRSGVPRWRAVMETFQLGSTYATALCERFRLDPEEKVRR